ncbi:MAG: V-type ATPase subunit [Syntrophobacteraceae bacterium]
MKGRLLSLRDYASMVREPAANSFKISGAREVIESKETLFREQIAPVIRLAEACYRYTPLFLAFLRQYEAQNAKILVAKAFGKQSLEQWYDIRPFAILDKDLLGKKLSLDEIKTLLADTYLADDFKDISSYRRMEIGLDIGAAGNLYRASMALSPQAKKEFQEILLKRISVLTVIWSWRLRSYYHWSDEKIRLYMEKFHNLFGGHTWSQVGIMAEALNRHLEQLYKDAGKEHSIVDIERRLEQDYYTWISSMFHKDFHSLYCVVAYLWLLFYQIRNLFRIIDGRRFGFSSEAILNKIICET